MSTLRAERNGMAVEWVRAGEKQAADMGGEELLSCRFSLLRNGAWQDVTGSMPTQVRAEEDRDLLVILLDKLLDRFEAVSSSAEDEKQMAEFRDRILWFGPEMAEEY